LGEARQQLLLLVVELRWGVHVDAHEEVPTTGAAEVRHAATAHHEDAAVLRARLDFHLDLVAIERLDVRGGTERDLCDVQRQLVDEVVVHTREPLVLADVELDVEVASGTTTRTRVALAGDAELLTVLDTCRDAD